jgi:hypothetical protein
LPPLKAIGDHAASSDSFTVATSGMLLSDTVTDAITSHDQGNDAKWPANVTKYVRGLRKSCALAGYPT